MNALLNFSIFLTAFVCINVLVSASGRCGRNQWLVLYKLRDTLEFDPANSTKLLSWRDNSIDCCIWKGVYCNTVGEVIGLDLSQENISGGINDSSLLFSLDKLQRLNLAYNNFNSKPIPSRFGSLTSLIYLNLSHSYFGEQIPAIFSQMTRLKVLELPSNNFTGRIPSLQLCKNLRHLNLSGNSFSGSIPSAHFLHLHKLLAVDLGFNALSGSLPSSLFCLPQVQKIHLSNNNFNGSLVNFPNASMSCLETLDLSSNRLRGEIPVSFFELSMLTILLLSSNNLNGTIKFKAFQHFPNLTTLDLSYSNLSVETSDTDFTMFPVPQLLSLKLASCNLQTIPNLRNQSRLSILDLSNNNISEEVPLWVWDIGNGMLSYFNISHNQIASLQKPFVFPESLSVLDLNSNRLTGVIPTPPPFATYIDYSDNLFSSSITNSIGSYLGMAIFFLVSNNLLSGPIPQTICNASNLHVLDMSHNRFSGRIPECLFECCGKLHVLNLGNNSLSGPIIGTFTSNCSLTSLDLHGNSLQGKIPKSLENCKMLKFLNLGNNKINDIFPCFLRNNSNVQVLVLRSNMLHGGLHCVGTSHSTPWEKLHIFDIAFNRFTGVVPADLFLDWHDMMMAEKFKTHRSFMVLQLDDFYYQDTVIVTIKGFTVKLVKILSSFTSIDISSNHFGGEIPSNIGRLQALYFLNISNNEFTGSIPSSIGNLNQLDSLDMSKNKFVGEIPSSFTGLRFLTTMNLSYNQLEGKIPEENQFQTFVNSSYVGNTRLCGSPLTKICSFTGVAAVPPASTNSRHNSKNFDDFISRWTRISCWIGDFHFATYIF
ncbi:Leucine-rich repeat-containing protein [Artemisia annua]|uniref:Leucine-rich repeat-containing protein n=1 Tax=Artemisia annua TaxID=35608 RepID=A0A2U1P4R3_ARTAN|nr:Leucine-rich repeat-containing protein [Artemisia annua]